MNLNDQLIKLSENRQKVFQARKDLKAVYWSAMKNYNPDSCTFWNKWRELHEEMQNELNGMDNAIYHQMHVIAVQLQQEGSL